MSDQERAAKREADMADVRAALAGGKRGPGQRRTRRLFDHGPGIRRLRIVDRLQDRRQGRQRDLPQGHAASPDLGLHRGRRQMEHRRGQRLRRPVEQQPRRAGQRPAGPGRQAVRPVEPLAHPASRRANDGVPERQAGGGPRHDGELLGSPALRCSRKGPIQLQTHGGEIRWRNIFVREIPADEANRILAQHGGEGFEPVFNGKDFRGWAGPVENYEVSDGAIVCKPGKGGTIYTKDEYDDFVARLEFQLPPGGNNGLAIRYPGSGDTAYMACASCRCWIRNIPSMRSSTLRQYHGSVYGMVPAQRGFLRPTGQWNFQEVTVKGPPGQSRAERQRHPGRRSEPGHGVHGQLAASGQGPQPRVFWLRRPFRPGGMSKTSGIKRLEPDWTNNRYSSRTPLISLSIGGDFGLHSILDAIS